MKRFILCCIAAMLSAVAYGQSELVGKTEAELIALKGEPLSKASVSNRAIYRWPDSEITLTAGKVSQVRTRDAQREKEANERAASAKAAMKERVSTVRQQPQATPIQSQNTPSYLEALRQRNAEREATRQREQADAPRRKAEREADFARRESLRVEINRLKADTRQAYKNGDKRTSGVMAEEYRAKVRERDALDNKINNSRR